MRSIRYRLCPLLLICAFLVPLRAADPQSLDGVWLFESADQGKAGRLGEVWTSKITVKGDAMAIAQFMGAKKDLKGSFVLGDGTIDLKLEEFDLAEVGAPLKIPAGKLAGIWKRDGDKLTVCLNIDVDGKRPGAFAPEGDKTVLLTLRKAPDGFKEFPKEVTVKVVGPDCKPAAGASVFGFMNRYPDPKTKEAKSAWDFMDAVKADAAGTAKVPYEELRFRPIMARDEAKQLVGIASISPASLAKGEATVTLTPERKLIATIECDALKQAGKELGWTNFYLLKDGRRIAGCSSLDGKADFPVPAGKYTLHGYGGELKGRYVPDEVPDDRSEFAAEPIKVTASKLVLLQGKPAPEFEGVVGWKGKPVKLADLKGKIVLVDFWGYWCGPCVGAMPVLIELHEKYADKGLAIVGVHLDGDGEVDTAEKLDEKIAGYKKELWKGKDLPFPSALTSGKRVGEGDDSTRGVIAAQYGILSYPTTVLIDREGKIVGKFHARDIKQATEEVERLLKGK